MMSMVSRLVILACVTLLAGACRGPIVPLEIDVRTERTIYAIGDRIVVEATVRNLRDTPLAYRAQRGGDLFVGPIDESDKRSAEDFLSLPQPDGSKDAMRFMSFLGPHLPNADGSFVYLAPREEKVFTKEYVARRPGKYEAVFGIDSPTDMEEEWNWPSTSPGQPKVKPKAYGPWLIKQRKVPNAWIGSVPKKSVIFEVREK